MVEIMKKCIDIKDGTSKSQLLKAIKNYEKMNNTTVLKISIFKDHHYHLVDYNGINVTRWDGLIDDFINNVTERLDGKYITSTMRLLEII